MNINYETIPVGIRNNNPGNLRHYHNAWKGLSEPPSDGRFCRFIDQEHGLRAIAKTLLTYQNLWGLRTVEEIIHRWAPPGENRTDDYVESVLYQTGLTDEIDMADYHTALAMLRAIVRHENGAGPLPGGDWYTMAQYGSALMLAGITCT